MANIRALRVKANGKTIELKLFPNDDAAVVLPDVQHAHSESQRMLRSLVTTIADEDSAETIADKIAIMASEKAELIEAVNKTMMTEISPTDSLVDVAAAIADPELYPYKLFDGVSFYYSKIKTMPVIDTSEMTSMKRMFYYCKDLISFSQSKLQTKQVVNMREMFRYCSNLIAIPEMDISSCEDAYNMFGSNSVLQFLKIRNLGATDTTINFSSLRQWGMNTDENKQSLIDTLLTYSCDRVAAGKSPMTIRLYSSVYKLLNENERALIAAKGYTLTY